MGDLFFCSRTDVLRAIYLDTGRSVGMIGAPADFLEWIEKILPKDTVISGDIEGFEACELDMIICWFRNELPSRGKIDAITGHLARDGDLWVVVPLHLSDGLGESTGRSIPDAAGGSYLMITSTHVLVPVILGSESFQKSESDD